MSEISRDDLSRALNVETAEVERLKALTVELLAALERWEQFARDNQWTEEDCSFLAATRDAIAKAKGARK